MTAAQEREARLIAASMREIHFVADIVDDERGPRVEVRHPRIRRRAEPLRVGVVELEPKPRIAEADPVYRPGIRVAFGRALRAGGNW